MDVSERNRWVEYTLYLSCLLSNISQLPVFVRAGATQLIAFPGWIALSLTLLFFSRKLFIRPITKILFALGVLLLIWIIFDTVFSGNSYFTSSMFYSYLIVMFVFLLGSMASRYMSKRILNNVIYIFIISVIIVSVSIFIQYFGVGYNLATRRYAYASKNSVSQIIISAIIFLIVWYKPKNNTMKLSKIVAIFFLLWVTILLRSRATFVSLILCVITIAFSGSVNKNIRTVVLLVGFLGIVFILFSNKTRMVFLNNVIFAGRNTSSLDDITSGRISTILRFPKLMSGNWFTGIGATYYECFPLSAILQFGLFGGLIIIVISLLPLIYSYKNRMKSEEWFLLYLIALGYSVNGLFEGLTPFGPGIKCYFLWMLFGILMTRVNQFNSC